MELLRFLEGIRTPLWDQIMNLVTQMGDETFFMLVGMTVLWCVDKQWGFRMLMIGMSGSSLSQLLKGIFLVPRSWVNDPSFTIVESARAGAEGYSFPSGHAQSAVCVFGTLAAWLKKAWVRVLLIALMLLVAFSRLYLGVHTPLDVGASLVIFSLFVIAATALYRRYEVSARGTFFIHLGCLALIALSLVWLNLAPVTPRNIPEQDAHSIESVWKLLGAGASILLAWWVDHRYTRFETRAPLWVQALKLVIGALLLVAVKSGLKPVLVSLLGDHGWVHGLRYALMGFVGGVLWPMAFRFLPKTKA